jgi:hypothetical protein
VSKRFEAEYMEFRQTMEKVTNQIDGAMEASSLQSILRFENKVKSLDVCFLIDCTGSMAPLIKNAKDKMLAVLDKLNKQYGGLSVRIAVVCYRDVTDKKRFEVLPFTQSGEQARDFIGRLDADGGQDTCEDVNGGFQKVLYSLDWKHLTRTMIHIADAPPHGKRFH